MPPWLGYLISFSCFLAAIGGPTIWREVRKMLEL